MKPKLQIQSEGVKATLTATMKNTLTRDPRASDALQ